jgi:hypothetical protein
LHYLFFSFSKNNSCFVLERQCRHKWSSVTTLFRATVKTLNNLCIQIENVLGSQTFLDCDTWSSFFRIAFLIGVNMILFSIQIAHTHGTGDHMVLIFDYIVYWVTARHVIEFEHTRWHVMMMVWCGWSKFGLHLNWPKRERKWNKSPHTIVGRLIFWRHDDHIINWQFVTGNCWCGWLYWYQ